MNDAMLEKPMRARWFGHQKGDTSHTAMPLLNEKGERYLTEEEATALCRKKHWEGPNKYHNSENEPEAQQG